MPRSCAAARPFATCDGVVGGFARGQRAGVEHVPQRVAVEQLRHHVRHAALGADIVHDEDVRMVQRGGRARFLLEALHAIGVGRDGRGEDLEGDLTIQPRIARAKHFAHPARANRAENFVRTEARAG